MKSETDDLWAAFDWETSDQNRYSCTLDRVCVQVFNVNTGRIYIEQDFTLRTTTPHGGMSLKDRRDLAKLMGTPYPKVAHNAEFDLYLTEDRLGVPVNGPIHDTIFMVKHWRNDLPAYGLKSLSWWLFGDLYLPLTRLREWIHEHNMVGEDDIDFDMTQCPDKLVHNYCTHDVRMTAKIATMMWPKVKDNYAYSLDSEVIRLNSQMEANGITADVQFYERFIHLGNRRIRRNTRQASTVLGVEAGRKPTGNALRDHLSERGEDRVTPTGLVKTDDVVLRDHTDSMAVRAVSRIRTDQKQVNTYAVNILSVVNKEGRFHPGLMQSAAITRRWRAKGFYGDNGVIAKGNAQNFPRGPGIRTGIITPPGYGFVKFDLASVEPRTASHAMATFLDFDFYCKKYKEDEKFNMYMYVVENHTEHGKITKSNPIYTAYKHGILGIQYGVGVKTYHRTMVDNFELPYTLDECNDIYNTIRKQCPEFSALQRAVSSIIEDQGYITDDFGAIYYVSESYKGVNHYCQGCAGNIFKWWMVHTHPLMLDTKDYLFNVVHDEYDGAIWRDRTANKRVKAYCDVLKGLDIFELPIVAEASGLVDNWALAS